MKPETVLCPSCGNEWQIPLFEMVRRRRPLWCPACEKLADDRLIEAMKRYPEKAPQITGRGIEETVDGGPLAQARTTGVAPAR